MSGQKNIYAVDYYLGGLLYKERFAGSNVKHIRRVIRGAMPSAVVCDVRLLLAGVWA